LGRRHTFAAAAVEVLAVITAACTDVVAVAVTRIARRRMTVPIAVIGFAAIATGILFAAAVGATITAAVDGAIERSAAAMVHAAATEQ